MQPNGGRPRCARSAACAAERRPARAPSSQLPDFSVAPLQALLELRKAVEHLQHMDGLLAEQDKRVRLPTPMPAVLLPQGRPLQRLRCPVRHCNGTLQRACKPPASRPGCPPALGRQRCPSGAGLTGAAALLPCRSWRRRPSSWRSVCRPSRRAT